MARVKFIRGTQSEFLDRIKKRHKIDWPVLAEVCGVHRRTLFDWRRDKYNMGHDVFQLLRHRYPAISAQIKILPEHWNIKNAGRLGAIKRNRLYGNPGTPEGRSKGGLTSWRRYEFDPQRFVDTGFKGPKKVRLAPKSALLAEAIGIILGDGSLAKYQLTISLNSKADREYAQFVSKLFSKLFRIGVTFSLRDKNTCNLALSSVKLVQYLQRLGLKTGDKIRQQVSIPRWIFENKNYMQACLRGLIDTDGGVYYHRHVTKGIRYCHLGLGFTNLSMPLLKGAHKIFLALGFPAKINLRGHVFLYNRQWIKQYFRQVGTHNPHHLARFHNYFKLGEVPKRS